MQQGPAAESHWDGYPGKRNEQEVGEGVEGEGKKNANL